MHSRSQLQSIKLKMDSAPQGKVGRGGGRQASACVRACPRRIFQPTGWAWPVSDSDRGRQDAQETADRIGLDRDVRLVATVQSNQ